MTHHFLYYTAVNLLFVFMGTSPFFVAKIPSEGTEKIPHNYAILQRFVTICIFAIAYYLILTEKPYLRGEDLMLGLIVLGLPFPYGAFMKYRYIVAANVGLVILYNILPH